MSNDKPTISIVTPSFNQGMFLEETIQSVLRQNYPNLEYIIIDGGSTDDSVEIIKAYEHRLAFWVSEPDDGQAHAIIKGLSLRQEAFFPGSIAMIYYCRIRYQMSHYPTQVIPNRSCLAMLFTLITRRTLRSRCASMM